MLKKIVAVIGSGYAEETSIEYEIAFELGKLLIDENFRLLTGGLGGIMEAASKGARASENHKDGDIIGILPSLDILSANKYVDIPIATGLGIGRNIIVANSSAVVAIGGSSGTISEIAFAWQLGRLILSWKGSGWSKKLAETKLDNRREGNNKIDNIVFGFDKPIEAIKLIKKYIVKY